MEIPKIMNDNIANKKNTIFCHVLFVGKYFMHVHIVYRGI